MRLDKVMPLDRQGGEIGNLSDYLVLHKVYLNGSFLMLNFKKKTPVLETLYMVIIV